MRRRDFLQKTAFTALGAPVLAGAEGRAAAPAALPTPRAARPSQAPAGKKRNVLITSAHSRLAQAMADALAADCQIRLTAVADVRTSHPFTRCDLGHGAATTEPVRGMDAIVHVAEPLPGAGEAERIDHRTRCTYNLLRAAVQEGVTRVVYLSSLAMMTAYDPEFEVSEDWRPLPHSEATGLSDYLGEFTCREFARQGRLRVVVLRLGRVVRAEAVAGKPFDPLWVDERDVAQAVGLVLVARDNDPRPGHDRWSVFHIGHDSPRARFSVAKAKRLLGYKPQFNWSP